MQNAEEMQHPSQRRTPPSGRTKPRRTATRRAGAVLAFAFLFLCGPSALAEEPAPRCPICHRAASDDYPSKAGHVLLRGAVNTLFGWTELIRQPGQEARAGGPVLTGIGRGIGQSVTRTFAGAGELLTFWTPRGPKGYIRFADDCPICARRR